MSKFPAPLESIIAMLTDCDQPDQSEESKKLEAAVRHQIQQYADDQSAKLRAALRNMTEIADSSLLLSHPLRPQVRAAQQLVTPTPGGNPQPC